MTHAYFFTDHLDRYNSQAAMKDKPTEKPAGWHPGPGGHELRGEILAWGYMNVLLETLR